MPINEIIYFIITIAILVFVHEFGHFIAAKISKMRVDVFAIGFGYRLFGWNKLTGFSFGNLAKDFDGLGNTDYRLSAIPLGGYVKIAGMVDESMDTKNLSAEPQPYEFRSKSAMKKIFVITAGVLMNLLLAVIIFWGSNYFYGKNLTLTTTLGFIDKPSVADSLGFKEYDKILSINGKQIKYWEEVRTEIFINTIGKDLIFKIQREENIVDIKVARKRIPKDESREVFLPAKGLHPYIVDVLKDSKADSSGIKPGDIFLAIDSIPVFSAAQSKDIISSSKEKMLSLQVLRDKDTLDIKVMPNKEGKIGVAFGGYAYLGKTEQITYGFFESFYLAGKDIVRMTQLTFVMLKNVITGNIAFGQAFGGPIKIAQFAAKSANTGISSFLMFLALLSLSLAIINILPFPVLDGGHLVIIIIEAIIKKEIPLKVKIAINNVGMFLLFALMAFIIYNDIIGL
jgi:regulator of sigma E protease